MLRNCGIMPFGATEHLRSVYSSEFLKIDINDLSATGCVHNEYQTRPLPYMNWHGMRLRCPSYNMNCPIQMHSVTTTRRITDEEIQAVEGKM